MTGWAGGNGPGPRESLPPGSRSSAPNPPESAPDATPAPSAATNMLRRVIRIVNPYGLHTRVADRFSRTAKQYACSVTVWNGDAKADGKNIFDLILLVVLPDTEVVLEVDGPDAAKAVDPLCEVLGSPGGEDYTI